MATEIQDYEIEAWLGVARHEMSADQIADFSRLVRAYTALMDGRDGEAADYRDEDDAAWRAAYERAMGKLDVAARGRVYREAQDAVYAGAIIAVLDGEEEKKTAADATIARMTLRKAMRK